MKFEKLNCGIEDKEKYVVHIRALKQAINHGLKLRKVHTVIQFNQKPSLKNILLWILTREKKQKMNLKKSSLS